MTRTSRILAGTLLECCFLLICGAVMGGQLSQRFQQLSARDPIINRNTVCGNLRGLTAGQHEICADKPHAVASAVQGMKVATHECQHQFKRHKWNCSSLQTSNNIPHASPFLARGFKETAFAYAIASAGVAHMVAHACHLGKIEDCGCKRRAGFDQNSLMTAGQRKKYLRKANLLEEKKKFQTEGCDFNIEYALAFSVDFLDLRQQEDQQALIARHNNRAGRLIVANKMWKNCKCHGMSGSCSLETCWKQTPSFRVVGDEVKKLYEKAIKIEMSNSVSSRRNIDTGVKVDQLVYFEDSPRYCEPDSRIGFPGTKGRHCNRTTTGQPDSCSTLCCDRGYDTYTMKVEEDCRCKFHWCCYVMCDKCVHTKTVAVCR